MSLTEGINKVLFMDDEKIVRDVARHMLLSLGYEVELAGNGEEAVGKYIDALNSPRPFRVVILDLSVRDGMGGEEALRKLQAADPGVKAIMSSGYSDDFAAARYRDLGFEASLTKPYDIKLLNKVICAVIDAA